MYALINCDNLRVNKILRDYFVRETDALISRNNASELLAYREEGERKFAKYLGCAGTYFVDSGTKALQIALYHSGVREGDEVIVPSVSWPSTALAVLALKAKPFFVDIKEDCTIDEEKIEEKITKKTKAILPVHLFGHLCSMDKILDICKNHNLELVEDACQAHGSAYKGKKAGNFGLLNAFSFNHRKVISSMGAGGAIAFNNKDFYKKIDNAVNFVNDHKDSAVLCAGQSRMSYMDIIGVLAKLKFSKVIEKNRIEYAALYEEKLNMPHVKRIIDKENAKSVRHRYVCYFEKRDELKEFLKKKGVIAERPYIPMPRMKIFSKFAEGEKFPNSDYYYENALHLPLFSMMTKKEVLFVAESIKEFYK